MYSLTYSLVKKERMKYTVILAWYILKGHLTSLLDCTFFRQIDLVNVGAVCVLILLVDFLTFNTFLKTYLPLIYPFKGKYV